uniref:Transcription termination factor 2 n=1 Tax=Sphenodon punctatus TaxID=8508 RepID=A0A8D0GV58_SPHPU
LFVLRCSLCLLKTGIRDGPNKGKSFYVCGDQAQILFSAFSVPPSHCLIHEKYMVELQVLIQHHESEEYRYVFDSMSPINFKGELAHKFYLYVLQDPKAKLPTDAEFKHTSEVLHNPNGQRNPFKVLDKNPEQSWKQINNDSGEKHATEREKQVGKGEQTSDKKDQQKLAFESQTRKELQTKSSEAEAQKERIISLDKQQCGSYGRTEKHAEHVENETAVIPTEGSLCRKGRPEHSLLSLESQKRGSEPLEDVQLCKGESANCTDKVVKLKTDVGKKSEEKNLLPRECLTSQEATCALTYPHMPSGRDSAGHPALSKSGNTSEKGKCANESFSSNENEVMFVSSTSSKRQPSRPAVALQQGKDLVGVPEKSEKTTFSSFSKVTTSPQKEKTLDSKALHNQFSVQLKQKKSVLKTINMQKLPDKGERLLKQVRELEAALDSLNLSAEENAKEGKLPNPFCRTTNEPPSTVRMKKPQPLQGPLAASSLGLLPSSRSVPSLGSSQYYSHVYGDRLWAVHSATSDAINQLHKSLESCPTEETAAEDPPGLKVLLLLHQKQALVWLLWRENQSPCGGILADYMGLGKTLTMIALILTQKRLVKDKGKEKKLEIWMSKHDSSVILSHGTLIICPASLVHHWKKEVERHVSSGKLKVYLYHGPKRNKHAEALSEYDIFVTTYSLLSKEIPTTKEEGEVPAEDHNLEVKGTGMGTALKGHFKSYSSLLNCLWKSQVDNHTKKGGERLAILTRSLLLRRTKDQLDSSGKPLISLPKRHSQLHRFKLSEEEQSVYDVLFARSRYGCLLGRTFGADQQNPVEGSSQDASHVSSAVHILSLLLRLRQCCCHLSLLKVALDQANLNSEGLSLSLEEHLSALTLSELDSGDSKSTVSLHGTTFHMDLFETARESTKLSHLLTELKAIQSHSESQKSVIVSQWTSMLKVVAVHLKRVGLKYATVDGSINPKQRMDVVEEFNTNPKGPQVMLLSLLAGGVGLNLTGGNHLFLLDLHWNPALEDQACDRIYRVGQRNDVVIHRFVCEGTVEEKISELQTKKKELAQQVLSGTGESFTKLTLADLKILFGI